MITDGGPFRRKMPNRIGRWLSLVGTGMGNTECHSAAYDPVTDRYGCGLQDQGTVITASGNTADKR